MADEFRCPYCDKPCSSQSGLTLHIKKCLKRRNTETEMEDNTRSDLRDVDPRGDVDPTESSKPSRTQSASKPKQESSGPFNIGAFLIFGEHIPIMLDLNFASALADHILKYGSENRAILAFGHQLSKASGDD